MAKKKQTESLIPTRKRLIIEAAVGCFIEQGYHQTGMRDIAKRAGVSLGNLYNHFTGKEAVLAEIAALEAAELHPILEILQDHIEPTATLMRFADEYLEYAARPENALMGLEIISEAVRTPAVALEFSANRAGLVGALGCLLNSGVAMTEFRRFADVEEAAKLILDLVEGKALRCVFTGSPPDVSAREELSIFIRLAVSNTERA